MGGGVNMHEYEGCAFGVGIGFIVRLLYERSYGSHQFEINASSYGQIRGQHSSELIRDCV